MGFSWRACTLNAVVNNLGPWYKASCSSDGIIVSEVLEIVELENGDVVLRRSEHPDESLLTIQFSELVKDHLEGATLSIAKAMVQAATIAYSEIVNSEIAEDSEETLTQPTIH